MPPPHHEHIQPVCGAHAHARVSQKPGAQGIVHEVEHRLGRKLPNIERLRVLGGVHAAGRAVDDEVVTVPQGLIGHRGDLRARTSLCLLGKRRDFLPLPRTGGDFTTLARKTGGAGQRRAPRAENERALSRGVVSHADKGLFDAEEVGIVSRKFSLAAKNGVAAPALLRALVQGVGKDILLVRNGHVEPRELTAREHFPDLLRLQFDEHVFGSAAGQFKQFRVQNIRNRAFDLTAEQSIDLGIVLFL